MISLPVSHRGFVVGIWLVLGYSTCCQAGLVNVNAQLQEGVQVPPGFLTLYDSGVLSQVVVSHTLGTVGASTTGATGTISGNDITGMVTALKGTATMDAFWQDNITVGGLPMFTPVSVRFTNTLTSHEFLSGNGTAGAISILRLFVNNPVDLTLSNLTPNPDNGTQSVSQVVTLLSGDPAPFNFEEHLALRADSLTSQSEADAPNDIFIDVLTPGATITSASGVNYSSPAASVPEPGSLGYLLTGCLGLLAAIGSRRRQDASAPGRAE